MQPRIVKYNLKKLLFVCIVLFAAFVIMFWYLLMGEGRHLADAFKVTILLLNALLLFWFTRGVIGAFKNPVAMIIGENSLEVQVKNQMQMYLWSQISNWHIEKSGRFNYLVIESPLGNSTLNLNQLDISQVELESLLRQYKP